MLVTPLGAGFSTLVWPWLTLVPIATGGAAGVAGAGTFDLPVAIPPALALQTFYFQAAFADPAAPAGIRLTNGLEMGIGN